MSFPGQVRIIGGKWRGRLLPVMEYAGLRPSPDRVRETVFNWLTTAFSQAHCLDLFAGTGVLGFEALSRGAQSVVLVEKAKPLFAALQKAADKLGALPQCELIRDDALHWLSHTPPRPFDIVFLDPPFDANLLTPIVSQLNKGWVREGTRLYIETNTLLPSDALPGNWQCLKHKKAGIVHYFLFQHRAA